MNEFLELAVRQDETDSETAVAMVLFRAVEVEGRRKTLATSTLYKATRTPVWTLYEVYTPGNVRAKPRASPTLLLYGFS